VKHVEGDHYLLDIGSFVTCPQSDHVESNGNPGFKGTKWIIETKPDRLNRYTSVSVSHLTFGNLLML